MFMFGYLVDDIFPQSIVRKKKKKIIIKNGNLALMA